MNTDVRNYPVSTREGGEADGHRMAVTQLKIIFQPFNDGSRFDTGGELSLLGEALFLGERTEVSGAFAGFGLDVREVCLE